MADPLRSTVTPGRFTALATVALAAVLTAGVRPLLTGEARPRADAGTFYAPAVSLIGDFARAGRLLTWNPWIAGGRPDFADPQLGAASPLVILAAAAGGPPLGGYLLYWLVSWLAGGIGVLVLGARLRAPPWARLCAAAGFVSCGYLTGHAQHVSIVLAFSALPWFVWCLDRAVAGRSVPAALQAGAVWGLAGLSGYPGLVIVHGLYGGAWVLGRALLGGWPAGGAESTRSETGVDRPRPGPGARLVAPALLWAVTVATALAVLSPAYLAFFTEGRELTDRTAPLDRRWAIGHGALEPRALATFASPRINALGAENPGQVYPGDHSLASVYLAPVTLALASIALVGLGGGSRRWRWWLVAVGTVAFAAAFGDLLPVRGWLYDLVPPTRYFRFPSLFRGYALFTAVVLALEAGRDLAGAGRPAARRAWLAGGLAAAAGGVAALWTAAVVAGRVSAPLPAIGWGGWTALAWLGTAAAALAAGLGATRVRRLAVGALVALAVLDGYAALRLSERLLATRRTRQLEIWRTLDRLHRPEVSPLPDGLDRVSVNPYGRKANRGLVAKQSTFGAYDPFRNRYHQWWMRDRVLTGFVTGTERTWFARRMLPFEEVAPAADQPRHLRHRAPDLARFAARAHAVGGPLPLIHPVAGRALEGPLFDRRRIEELPAMERLPVELLEATPETLALRVRAPAAGWLVVTDRYSPSWRASVDGRPAPVHKAAFLFRAVALDSGSHEVRFELRPRGYRALLALSWSLLAFALVAIPLLAARRRRLAMLKR